jgi:EAL domain-containing protein (putative c-di-GMP-specific phosphodiesterase class I)
MRSELPPRMLELELTEATLTANREMTRRVVTELRNHGLRCIVEDFGLGNAGLGYLASLPIAGIKIDRSLVAAIGQHEAAPVIEAITAVSSVINARVGAEGITTPEQYRHLRGKGVTLMQGDLLCPPIDEDELESRLLAASLNRGTSMAPLLVREIVGPTTDSPLDHRVADLLVSMTGHNRLDSHALDHLAGRLPQGTLE